MSAGSSVMEIKIVAQDSAAVKYLFLSVKLQTAKRLAQKAVSVYLDYALQANVLVE